MQRELWDTNTTVERWNVGRKELNKYIKKFNKWDKNKNTLKGISLILKLQFKLDRNEYDDDWNNVYRSMRDEVLENEDIDDMLENLWKIRQGVYEVNYDNN